MGVASAAEGGGGASALRVTSTGLGAENNNKTLKMTRSCLKNLQFKGALGEDSGWVFNFSPRRRAWGGGVCSGNGWMEGGGGVAAVALEASANEDSKNNNSGGIFNLLPQDGLGVGVS